MRLLLMACGLLLASACIEANPDWDAPDGGGGTSESSSESAADSDASGGEEAGTDMSASTGDGDTTAGSTGDGDALNGCTFAEAMDLTGMPTVTITDLSEWKPGHLACIVVDAGTVIRWESQSFDAHGLVGGPAGMPDPESPFTQAGPGTGTTPIDVALPDTGSFPYYCDLHPMNMFGVVYVV